jgi:TRAP-type uncharacterized transport system substrate-binding protein
VLVPNAIRGADDFIAGAADALYFAFGGPKVREADATVGGIRMLAIPDSAENLAASRKLFPYGYLTQVLPIPLFVGVTRPMQAYTFDYMLFTSAKTKDDAVYKMIDTLVENKADLAAVAPHLQEFSAAALHKKFNMPYHAGALRYFADHNMPAVEIR